MADQAREAVDTLYTLRDKYFTDHAVDQADKKAGIVSAAIEAAVRIIDPLLGSTAKSSNPDLLFLKGKALNAEESHNQEAEDALAKAVKLDPKLVEGWNQLGECFWKKGDKLQARTCFDGALAVEKNKFSLQHKSMLLRSIQTSTEVERLNNISESLDIAKEAIKLDLEDGHSWFVLGNAFLALFFAKMETVEHLKQALKAYKKAEMDKVEAVNNPDLHQNRATVHEYLEEFSLAIEGYALASMLDPSWPQPKQSIDTLKSKCIKICDQISKKCGLKTKKISSLTALLSTGRPEDYTGVAELKVGVNSKIATRVAIVSAFGETLNTPAQTFLGMDVKGSWTCITVYNAEPEVLKVDDMIVVPEPLLASVKIPKVGITGESGEFEYNSIRVDNPVTLQVNGSALGEGKLVKNVLASTAKGAA